LYPRHGTKTAELGAGDATLERLMLRGLSCKSNAAIPIGLRRPARHDIEHLLTDGTEAETTILGNNGIC
jgi:hypothetical protein